MFSTVTGIEVSLFDEFRRLQRGTFPAVEVVATPGKVDVLLTAPGIDATGLDISLQRNVLSVTGRRAAPADAKSACHRQERFSGEFQRVIALPEDVDPERVAASYVDGVVRITVQRREAPAPRRIEIH